MELKKKVLAIIQARYNSTRFPGKVVKKINNKTILEILIRRLSRSKHITKIIVACSNNRNDKAIVTICRKLGVNYFIGSENDVLNRFYHAAKKYRGINSNFTLQNREIVLILQSNYQTYSWNY